MSLPKVPQDIKDMLFVVARKDGEECPFLQIEGGKVKDLSRLMLLQRDLLEAKKGLALMNLIHSGPSNISEQNILSAFTNQSILEAILGHAVISYARPFVDGQIDPNQTYSDPIDKDNHKDLYDLRNKFIAHREDNDHERGVIYAGYDPKDPTKLVGIYTGWIRMLGLSPEHIRSFISTIDVALTRIEAKLKKARVHVLNEVKNIDPSVHTLTFPNALHPTQKKEAQFELKI